MDEGGAAGLGQVPGKELGDPVDGAAAFRRDRVPAPGPAPDLPVQVALGTAEVAEVALRRLDQVQVGERVDDREADPASWLGADRQLVGTRSQTTTPGRYSETRKWAPMTPVSAQ